MSTATIRIPEEKRDVLKVIASIEKKDMKEIISELISEYIERHSETLDMKMKMLHVYAILPRGGAYK